MNNRNLHVTAFTSNGFLAGLFMLLLNDFVLKAQFANWLTGKLSDFAGLFIFPIFIAVLFRKHKMLAYFATAAIFMFWKSNYSSSLIHFWNSLDIFQIHRIVDYSDCIALGALPISYFYFKHLTETNSKGNVFNAVKSRIIFSFIVGLISVFAFIATSRRWVVEYDSQSYKHLKLFSENEALLYKILEFEKQFGSKYFVEELQKKIDESNLEPTQILYVTSPFERCPYIYSKIKVDSEAGSTFVRVLNISASCRIKDEERDDLFEAFEKNFISKLGIEYLVLN
jgi:hypothetical protein